MPTNTICTSEGEWSLTSSSRDIEYGRSERTSISLTVDKDDGTDQNNSDSSLGVSVVMQIDETQLGVLNDFLFDFLAPGDEGFQRSSTPKRQNSSDSVDIELGSIFETTFDLTEDRLRRLFDLFDGNENGTITYEDLKLGFAYHGAEFGMSQLDDRDFVGLVQYLDADKSGEITFEEFSEGIRLLMLRTILQQVNRSDRKEDWVVTEVVDYNSIRVERYLLKGTGQVKQAKVAVVVHSKSLVDFFLDERGNEVSVRWINITGKKASNIMKMIALKYRLHPLALQDALEHTDHRPKADSYDLHYFIMVPVFSLIRGKNSERVQDVEKQTKRTFFNRLFHTPKTKTYAKNYDAATNDEKSIDSDDGTENNLIGVHMTSIFITKPNGRTVITFNNELNEDKCWYKLQGELKKDYSKLRQYDGQYLAYRLLDEAVDKIGAIVKKLKSVVKKEKKSLANHNYRDLDRIHSLKQEMKSMSRKFKPFLRLLVHVIEDDSFSPGASIYLRDVLDNLEIHDDDVKNLIAKCDSADNEVEKFQGKQMDNSLYLLTVISATFLPAQFFTGKWIPVTWFITIAVVV
jgi:Mg2+ and Co2+ transporter CorA